MKKFINAHMVNIIKWMLTLALCITCAYTIVNMLDYLDNRRKIEKLEKQLGEEYIKRLQLRIDILKRAVGHKEDTIDKYKESPQAVRPAK